MTHSTEGNTADTTHASDFENTSESNSNRRDSIMIDTTDEIADFLAAVEKLRDEEGAVRTTAHTSSIIAAGWPSVEL